MKQIVNHLSYLTILTIFLPTNKIIFLSTFCQETREKEKFDLKKDRNNEQENMLGERKLCETSYFTEERQSGLGSALRYQ